MKESYCFCGLSTFSSRAAVSLHAAGREVIAIDRDSELVERVRDEVTRAACADLRDRDVLRELGALDCDVAVVAVPRDFDIAILTVNFFREERMERVIAQVNSDEEAAAIRVVGATDVVFPERDAADHIVKTLLTPGLVDHFALSEDAELLELRCPASFVGKTLKGLDVRKKFGVYVIGFKKPDPTREGGERTKLLPSPKVPLSADEILLVAGSSEKLARFAKESS